MAAAADADRAVADLGHLAGRDDRSLPQAAAAVARRPRDGGGRDVQGQGAVARAGGADGAGGPQKLDFAVSPSASDDSNSYLTQLVEQARTDGGVTLPLVGAASLAEARQEINAGVRGLDQLAREALAAGNLANAEQLVAEALRRDPNDTEALAIKGAVAKRQAAALPAAGGRGRSAGSAPPPAPDAGGRRRRRPEPGRPRRGRAAAGHDGRGLRARSADHCQVIQTEVQNALSQARSLMGTDPDVASQQLKLTLEKVRQTAELNPDVRDQFVDLLQTALREAARRKVEVEQARQQRLENAAAAKERLLIAENLIRNQEKVKQLMARFNSLMHEGRYRTGGGRRRGRGAEGPARQPRPACRRSVYARMMGYYENIMALRERGRRASSTRCTKSRSRTSRSPTIRRSSTRTPKSGSK